MFLPIHGLKIEIGSAERRLGPLVFPKSGRTSERDRKMDSGDQPNVKPIVLCPRPITLARISIDIESAST